MASFVDLDVRRRLIGGWPWVIAYGIILIAVGATALARPFASAVVIGFFLGWSLSLAGAFGIVAGFRARHARGHGLDVAVGLVTLALGLLILLDPLAGTLALLWSASLWFTVRAVMEFATASRFREERGGLVLLGILDIVLALLLLLGFATFDVALVSLLVGLTFLASGLFTLFSGMRLRGAARRLARVGS